MDIEENKNTNGLPRGFQYQERVDLLMRQKILDVFFNSSNVFYTHLLEFPPVSYLEQFRKGANIVGDKVFGFLDKKGRKLVLTPDSQAHTFNHYVHLGTQKNVRYSWISPIFRYRNIPQRYYNQIGYTSINHEATTTADELFLAVRQLSSLVGELVKGAILIEVVNPALIKEITQCVAGDNDLGLFDQLKNCKDPGKVGAIINSTMKDSASADILRFVLSGGIRQISDLSKVEKFSQATVTRAFLELLIKVPNIEVQISLDNIYCSEVLAGPGFIIKINNEKVGDGGIYDQYGNNFDNRINTVVSVCVVAWKLTQYMNHKEFTSPSISIEIKPDNTNINIYDDFSREISQYRYRTSIYKPYKRVSGELMDTDWRLKIQVVASSYYSAILKDFNGETVQEFKNSSVSEIAMGINRYLTSNK